MAASKQKTSGKSGTKSSAPAKVASAAGESKTASAPASSMDAPAKRVVMTSSEIEAAAQKPEPLVSAKPAEQVAKLAGSDGTLSPAVKNVATPAAKPETVEVPKQEAAEPAAVAESAPIKPAEAELAPAKTAETASPASETGAKAKPVAKPGAVKVAAKAKSAAPKSTAPAPTPQTEKASIVTTKSKSAATPQTVGAAAPKKATPSKAAPKKVAAAPATETSKTVAKPTASPAPKAAAKSAAPETAAPAASAEPKAAAKPKAEPAPSIPGDVFGFGSMFMDASAMEPYMELWKTPEIEAIVTASNDAFEDGVSVANEAFNKMFETMTGQADVFSGAGSRVAAQYEDILDNQKKSFEEVWQATLTLFEKTGGIGTELATWMQKEFEASQSDLDAMTKVESLADLQELNSKIISRYYESSVAEGEKVQEIMLAAITDSFNAFSKATNAVMK